MTHPVKYYGVTTLPQSAETGALYFTSNGQFYIGTSTNEFKEFTPVLFVKNLPEYGELDKIYAHKLNGEVELKVWNGIEYINVTNPSPPIKNTFIFFVNQVSNGEIQARAKIQYNAKIAKVETILSNSSVNDLSFYLEKSVDGINFTTLNINETITAGNALQFTEIVDEILLNQDEILRITLSSDNNDVNGLTVNVTIEEFK